MFPLHLSLPWGLGIGPLPHLPMRSRLRYRVGAPVPFPSGFVPGTPVNHDVVLSYDTAVRTSLQAQLDALVAAGQR